MKSDFGNSLKRSDLINPNTVLRNTVGGKDKFDFLRFTLNQCSDVSISLSKLTRKADLLLLKGGGELISSSIQVDKRTRNVSTKLEAGSYVLRVSGTGKIGRYQLKMVANPCSTTPTIPDIIPIPETTPSEKVTSQPFNALYGYGLVNAAAAVARSIGQTAPFPDVNIKDYFAPNPDLEKFVWGLDSIKAPESWAKGYTGQGVVVAVIDSGISIANPRLNANVWRNNSEISGNGIDDDLNGFVDDTDGWDFVNNDNTPIDIEGHGTFVAGIIADTASGVAKNAKVMAIKVAVDGFALNRNISQGIYYAVQNGAKIINISYGSLSAALTPDLQQALQFARQSDVLVVAAAGNSRKESAFQPDNIAYFAATRNYGITVGATDRAGKVAGFSSPAGNIPIDYVVAPGVDVYSDTFDSDFYSTFERGSGTSFSAPAVAGIAALMLSANPLLKPDEIETILVNTASLAVAV
jgi:subtilisin family serine protease